MSRTFVKAFLGEIQAIWDKVNDKYNCSTRINLGPQLSFTEGDVMRTLQHCEVKVCGKLTENSCTGGSYIRTRQNIFFHYWTGQNTSRTDDTFLVIFRTGQHFSIR